MVFLLPCATYIFIFLLTKYKHISFLKNYITYQNYITKYTGTVYIYIYILTTLNSYFNSYILRIYLLRLVLLLPFICYFDHDKVLYAQLFKYTCFNKTKIIELDLITLRHFYRRYFGH